jgi:hypothetical protein
MYEQRFIGDLYLFHLYDHKARCSSAALFYSYCTFYFCELTLTRTSDRTENEQNEESVNFRRHPQKAEWPLT